MSSQYLGVPLDPYFRSTLTDAQVYMSLYKVMEDEIEKNYMNYALDLNN